MTEKTETTIEKEPRDDVITWLQERWANCLRISKTKQGNDRTGWLEDAEFFRWTIEAIKPERIAELEMVPRNAEFTSLQAEVRMVRDALAQAEAREADSRHCFKRIIQVRAGDGMLQGKEALDEMARLAGEALSRLDQPETGDG